MPGAKHGLVLKSCAPDLLTQRRNLLLEVYGKYRPNHEAKLKEAENLAKVLEPLALTVGGYDTADNFLPAEEFGRERYASHAEWYWIPVNGAPKKLSKPKKDPPMKKVLQFLGAQAPDLPLTVPDMLEKWEIAMKENPPPKPEPDLGGVSDMAGLSGLGDLSDLGSLGEAQNVKTEL
ncbi:unnamed protein product [Effrenium voratum]|uniref:Uncharacterized protein n=1 Tax=Effrenium voratum TaxID=2562239 RepID=A0AA36I853_9DINO|nr:unnamed protein product [Effrenium voratum]CAJ1430204.1 unnamed protein product [Effrenium voratum]